MTSIRTLAASLRHEPPKIRGSRFIASVAPVGSAEEATAFIEARRREFHDATHGCFAWRVGSDANHFRTSDDGEPSGTAGRPILREIDGRELTDVVVVVTRYYGGTKLGTGGLIRAYAGAASAALERAEIVEVPIVRSLRLHFPYELTGAVRSILNAFALTPGKSAYGAEVEMEIAVPVAEADRVCRELREATAGRIGIEEDCRPAVLPKSNSRRPSASGR